VGKRGNIMKSVGKATPWWLNVVAGILIIAAGIFLLVSPQDGNDFLTVVVGVGIFIFCLYNIIKAVQNRNDNRLFIPYLAHGLLDLVLLLLVITIPSDKIGSDKTQISQLIGIIISCWLIIFGFFMLISKKSQNENPNSIRNGLFLVIAGAGILLILLFVQIVYVIFLGILALIIGIIKILQGIMYKARDNDRTSGSRQGLF
jgi:uncharacterized membrane protein HdeD (DUF308 family)